MKSNVDKQFLEIDSKSILEIALSKFVLCEFINEIIIVTSADHFDECRKIAQAYKNKTIRLAEGGSERYISVQNGLKACSGECDYVFIHDGVRPFIRKSEIYEMYKDVQKYGACVPAVPVKDTIKVMGKNEYAENTLDRSRLYAVQTPQVFSFSLIANAYSRLSPLAKVTDDASVAELAGCKIHLSRGRYENIKITTPEDMYLARAIYEKEKADEGC